MISKIINNHLFYWCEGCKFAHHVPFGEGVWKFEGTEENPSLSPSVRHFYIKPATETEPQVEITICHYWIKNGNIEYCGDCQHQYSGQTRKLIDIPEDYALPTGK